MSRLVQPLSLAALGGATACGDLAAGPPHVGRILVWVLLGVAILLALLGAFGRYR